MPRIGIPKSREEKRVRRHLRVRKKVTGTPERPRLVVYRSVKHIYAQLVDDVAQRTLMTVSSPRSWQGKKTEKSAAVGKAVAERAKDAGITQGRVRSRGVQVPRPGESGGGRRPRRRVGVLSRSQSTDLFELAGG